MGRPRRTKRIPLRYDGILTRTVFPNSAAGDGLGRTQSPVDKSLGAAEITRNKAGRPPRPIERPMPPSSSGPGPRVLSPVTGVQIPLGVLPVATNACGDFFRVRTQRFTPITAVLRRLSTFTGQETRGRIESLADSYAKCHHPNNRCRFPAAPGTGLLLAPRPCDGTAGRS